MKEKRIDDKIGDTHFATMDLTLREAATCFAALVIYRAQLEDVNKDEFVARDMEDADRMLERMYALVSG